MIHAPTLLRDLKRHRRIPYRVDPNELKALADRAEKKDDIDVYTLLRFGCSVASLVVQAKRQLGPSFNAWPSLKALGYFEVGNLSEKNLR